MKAARSPRGESCPIMRPMAGKRTTTGAPASGAQVAAAPLVVLVLTLLAVALWRESLAVGILFKPTIENNLGSLVHWRQLDNFAGPLCLLLLAATGRRWVGLATVLVGAGTLLLGTSILAMQWAAPLGLQDWLMRSGAAGLALGAGTLVVRELKEVSDRLGAATANVGRQGARQGAGGLDLIDLARLVMVQWVLVWAAAEVFLRFRLAAVDLAASAAGRVLLFSLPTLGILPNLLMSTTLRWGPAIAAGKGRARPRACLVGMVVVNVGAIVMVVFPKAAGVGGALVAAGVGLFVIGLPGVRVMLAAAWAVLAVGVLGVAGLSAYTVMTGQPVLEYVAAGMRYVLMPGALVLWLAAAGWGALGLVPERWRGGELGRVAIGCLVVALVGTVGAFWLEAGVGSGIQLLALSSVAELAGVVLGGALALRGLRMGGGMRGLSAGKTG